VRPREPRKQQPSRAPLRGRQLKNLPDTLACGEADLPMIRGHRPRPAAS